MFMQKGLTAFFFLACMYMSSFAGYAGAVFILNGKHLYHEKVPNNAPHQYYGTLEGPSWENSYCTWRTYIDQDNRNIVDITGKKDTVPTLFNYDKSGVDVHADNAWGTDIFECGTTMGLGSFRLQYGDETWRNPELGGNLDSMVVDLLDTTYESPRFRIAYWGWKITSSAKIDAFWTIQTKKEMRSTICELKIQGTLNKTKVVVGMTKASSSSGTSLTQDSVNGNLITLGKQSQQGDSLLLAIHTDKTYFNKFSSNSTNYAIILNLDENQTAKWAFMHSWVKEKSTPFFRLPDWKSKLFNDLPAQTGTSNAKNISILANTLHRDIHAKNVAIYDVSGKKINNLLKYSPNNTPLPDGIYFAKTGNTLKNGKNIVKICKHNR